VPAVSPLINLRDERSISFSVGAVLCLHDWVPLAKIHRAR
jgi:hypothetical protein